MKKNLLPLLISILFVQMIHAGTISGTVTKESDGSPITSAYTYVYDYDSYSLITSVSSDANGSYTTPDLPAGLYMIRCFAAGYATQYYSYKYYSTNADPVPVWYSQNTTGINFELVKGVSVSGTITDSSGLPVNNAYVECFEGYSSSIQEFTDANGNYSIMGLLPNKTYKIAAYPPDESDDAITGLNVNMADVSLTGIDIQLDPDGVSVSGFITDQTTGLPLDEISILALAGDLYGGRIYTEPNGIYQLDHLPPVCEVRILVEPPEQYAKVGQELCLSSDVNDLNFELILGSSVSGVLIDADTGKPVPGVRIDYWLQESGSGCWDTTNIDGTFHLSQLYPGIGEFQARPDFSTGYTWSFPEELSDILVPYATDIQGRFIAIQKGAVATGRLLDGSGAPLANTKFYYITPLTGNWNNYTDSNGEFAIRLPVGTYGLVVEVDDDVYSTPTLQVNVPDLTTPISLGDIYFYSESDGSTISGTFSNLTSAPCRGMFVVVAFNSGYNITPENINSIRPITFSGISEVGPYEINKLPPGSYDIWLLCIDQPSEHNTSAASRYRIADVPVGSTNINLVYPSEGGTVTGIVKNIAGENILGASVILSDSVTGICAGLGSVQPDGSFVIYNVAPGTYTLTATHLMYQDNTLSPVTITEGGTTNVSDIILDFAGTKQGPDINGDGQVNVTDLSIYVDQWLTSGSADLNDSGSVDLKDFAPLSNLWMMRAIWRE